MPKVAAMARTTVTAYPTKSASEMKLRAMMGDLQELSEELWSENGGQQDHEISRLHFSIRHLLERALAILGRLD